MTVTLSDLHNKFSGKAFLVGNGPSLNNTPMDALTGRFSFGMNMIARKFSATTWRPSFYVGTSTSVVEQKAMPWTMQAMDSAFYSFIWIRSHHVGEFHRERTVWIECSQYGEQNKSHIKDEWFSVDPEQPVSKWGTSMLAAVQLAYILGFREMYLVGCDLGYTKHGQNHFYTNELDQKKDFSRDNAPQMAAHGLIKRASEIHGFEIYNATVGGELDVYKRVELMEVLE